jgi:DNA-binding PadR family transcriptional regulator
MAWGLVREDTPPRDDAHPGRARRWYALTPAGHTRLIEESRRLIAVATLAQNRLKARPS